MAAERNERGDFYIFDGDTSHWVGSTSLGGSQVAEALAECESLMQYQMLLAQIEKGLGEWMGYQNYWVKPETWPWEYPTSRDTYYTTRWSGSGCEVYVYGTRTGDGYADEGDAVDQHQGGDKATWFPTNGGKG